MKYFSNLSLKRGFDISYRLSPMDGGNLHEMSCTVSWEKYEKYHQYVFFPCHPNQMWTHNKFHSKRINWMPTVKAWKKNTNKKASSAPLLLGSKYIATDKALFVIQKVQISFLFLHKNICCGEIRKILCGYPLLSVAM